VYRIYALKAGECRVPKKFTFYGYEGEEDEEFFLYVWVIKGEDLVAVVDTGPKDLESMNKQAAHVMSEPITRREEEELENLLSRAGVEFEDVKYLFITHMHYDHCSDADRFPNATVVVSRKGYERAKEDLRRKGVSWVPEGFIDYLDGLKDEGKLILAEDGQEIAPGIVTYIFGGHCPCAAYRG